MVHEIRLAVSVALQDAGEATRSIEIVTALCEKAPEGWGIRPVFLSHGGRFERQVLDAGFELFQAEPRLEGAGFRNDLKPTAIEFVGSPELAFELLKGEVDAFETLAPDIVLHGFWPFAGIARRCFSPPLPSVCFLPIPFEPVAYSGSLMKDLPDAMPLAAFLPAGLRRAIARVLPPALKLKAPLLKQRNIAEAARRLGRDQGPMDSLFDMLRADLTVVNDLPLFYEGMKMSGNFVLTGPLYAPDSLAGSLDRDIRDFLADAPSDVTRIFCTMGSSGTKERLLEAIEALVSLPESRYRALVLVPVSVCPLAEAADIAAGRKNLFLTDRFVPARIVNGLCDIVVCHGGQGTVQTALGCGTPLVAVAMQAEQQINLDNIAARGAGIRIPASRWKAKNIRRAVERVAGDVSWAQAAKRLSPPVEGSNGRAAAAVAIWAFIRQRIEG